MNMNTKQLEQLAIDAHERGLSWCDFWDTHRHAIALCEPFDRGRFHRLVRRLSHLVSCGDLDGHRPAGDPEPWELDDEGAYPVVSDSETAARCLWQPGDGSESQ